MTQWSLRQSRSAPRHRANRCNEVGVAAHYRSCSSTTRSACSPASGTSVSPSSSTTSWDWRRSHRCWTSPSSRPQRHVGTHHPRVAGGSRRPGHPGQDEVNAWDDAGFVAKVRQTGRGHLILAGLSFDVCASLPAIAAQADGYQPVVAVDAYRGFSRKPSNLRRTVEADPSRCPFKCAQAPPRTTGPLSAIYVDDGKAKRLAGGDASKLRILGPRTVALK